MLNRNFYIASSIFLLYLIGAQGKVVCHNKFKKDDQPKRNICLFGEAIYKTFVMSKAVSNGDDEIDLGHAQAVAKANIGATKIFSTLGSTIVNCLIDMAPFFVKDLKSFSLTSREITLIEDFDYWFDTVVGNITIGEITQPDEFVASVKQYLKKFGPKKGLKQRYINIVINVLELAPLGYFLEVFTGNEDEVINGDALNQQCFESEESSGDSPWGK